MGLDSCIPSTARAFEFPVQYTVYSIQRQPQLRPPVDPGGTQEAFVMRTPAAGS